MVKGATRVHIHFVVIPQMSNQEWNIPNNGALGPCIGAIVRPEIADSLVLELAIVRKDLWAPKRAVFAGKFERFCHFL